MLGKLFLWHLFIKGQFENRVDLSSLSSNQGGQGCLDYIIDRGENAMRQIIIVLNKHVLDMKEIRKKQRMLEVFVLQSFDVMFVGMC